MALLRAVGGIVWCIEKSILEETGEIFEQLFYQDATIYSDDHVICRELIFIVCRVITVEDEEGGTQQEKIIQWRN